MSKIFLVMGLFCVWCNFATAQIIDDISLRSDTNGEVDAVIRFTVPIQKLRYAQQHQASSLLVVYFNILGDASNDPWQDYESHRAPPSENIPNFTVTTRDLNTNPKIEIQFDRPAELSLKAGRDGRSLVLHIKVDAVKKESEDKPISLPVVVPVVAPIAAVVAAPSVIAKVVPTVPTPAVSAPPVAAVVVAPPPVPVVVTASVVAAAPVATLPPLVRKTPTGQLGGKDGLPIFPKIAEPLVSVDSTPPPPDMPLAEQIKRANNQAAALMVQGRDALLTGEMYAAIEAFNNVLKLPDNQYSQDAQVWVGIAREKSGQPYKAKLEYETYLKLYPNGTETAWVKDRFAKLNAVLPAQVAQTNAPRPPQHTEFQTTEYGSVSMYYYSGASRTDTITSVGAQQIPTSLTRTDQSTLLTSVNMTARTYNNEFDNRLVFQEFNATNFLPQQPSRQQLNAFYYDVKNRIDNYSARVGRQSPYGGGVMGRFDGATGGYGVTQDMRVNVVAGQLADTLIGPKPVFAGASVDLGLKGTFGGSLYAIKQMVSGLTDRQAVGGNVRYFAPGMTAISMLDYDTQFKAVNMLTLQGTLSDGANTDYNFLLDHRRSPMLSIRSAVNGTPTPIDILLQSGFTKSDLVALAAQRTATSNLAMIGVNNRLNEKWQVGSDLMLSNISGMPQSGTLINGTVVNGVTVGGTPGLEGFLPATPATGTAWTVSGRLMGNDLFFSRDLSIASLSYTNSQQMKGETFLLNNHTYLQELWTFDSTLRLYLQSSAGGKQDTVSPVFKLGYRLRNMLTLESEVGLEMTKVVPSGFQSSTINRKYFSLGFRWDI